MGLVIVDQKLRIRLPKNARKALNLRSKQSLEVEVKKGEVLLRRPSPMRLFENDPMWRDMLERPFHSKIKITTELLEKLGEEQMMGL